MKENIEYYYIIKRRKDDYHSDYFDSYGKSFEPIPFYCVNVSFAKKYDNFEEALEKKLKIEKFYVLGMAGSFSFKIKKYKNKSFIPQKLNRFELMEIE